jgi:hypothetical protein
MARLGVASRGINDDLHGLAGGVDERVRPSATSLSQLQPTPVQSDQQGVGKSPMFRWPWQKVTEMLVPKAMKQGAVGATAAGRSLPSRPERKSWSGKYLLYYEQANRHVWPGTPGSVIERPTSVPFTANVPNLGGLLPNEGVG